jgi:hypothetical protein
MRISADTSVSLMADFASDQKHPTGSPYLRRPLRSIRQACLDKAANAKRSPECVDCAMNDACQSKAAKQIGAEERG